MEDDIDKVIFENNLEADRRDKMEADKDAEIARLKADYKQIYDCYQECTRDVNELQSSLSEARELLNLWVGCNPFLPTIEIVDRTDAFLGRGKG